MQWFYKKQQQHIVKGFVASVRYTTANSGNSQYIDIDEDFQCAVTNCGSSQYTKILRILEPIAEV